MINKNKHILITGGSGLVGSSFKEIKITIPNLNSHF